MFDVNHQPTMPGLPGPCQANLWVLVAAVLSCLSSTKPMGKSGIHQIHPLKMGDLSPESCFFIGKTVEKPAVLG
jgi:hypothetical protein